MTLGSPSCRRGVFLLLLLVASGSQYANFFMVSGQRYDVADTTAELVKKRQAQVTTAADMCVSTLSTSLGQGFLQCVLQRLQDAEFPVPPYQLSPLTVQPRKDSTDVHYHGNMLLDLLRNYTCGRIEDGGTRPLQETTWVFDEEVVMSLTYEQTCPSGLVDPQDFFTIAGYLPSGDDVDSGEMTVGQAEIHCRDELPECEGFTFQKNDDDTDAPQDTTYAIFFKGVAMAEDVGRDRGWQTHIRRTIPSRCLVSSDDSESDKEAAVSFNPPREYHVEILRHEPLVAIIPNFASEQECSELMEAGGSDESMGRAHENDGPSSYRRSYSSNIYIDYEDRNSILTRFAERMFGFVRNITGYDVHGPGQEPVNAVLYKDVGDEYRPHCDGPCDGGPYPYGQRVATSILYCQTPKDSHGKPAGGQTSFTRSGLMVAPRERDLLLFSYKYPNGTVDNGFTEHSGCKILGGRKWIATQWYREGVNYENPWTMMDF